MPDINLMPVRKKARLARPALALAALLLALLVFSTEYYLQKQQELKQLEADLARYRKEAQGYSRLLAKKRELSSLEKAVEAKKDQLNKLRPATSWSKILQAIAVLNKDIFIKQVVAGDKSGQVLVKGTARSLKAVADFWQAASRRYEWQEPLLTLVQAESQGYSFELALFSRAGEGK